MMKMIMTALVVSTVLLSVSAATYTVETTGSDTYAEPLAIDAASVSVDDGSGVVVKPFSEVKDSFVAGSVFRKRGEGYLKSSPSMFGFVGEIRIEEGGFMVITNRCLGPTASTSVKSVVVSNGASLVICRQRRPVQQKR